MEPPYTGLDQSSRMCQHRDVYTALHCTALHCTALHCTALHCNALHCTALHCTALHCTALHCTALHCTALHCTALHCTALHCTPGVDEQGGVGERVLTSSRRAGPCASGHGRENTTRRPVSTSLPSCEDGAECARRGVKEAL